MNIAIAVFFIRKTEALRVRIAALQPGDARGRKLLWRMNSAFRA